MSEHYPTCARAAFGEPPPCSCPPGWPQEAPVREPVKTKVERVAEILHLEEPEAQVFLDAVADTMSRVASHPPAVPAQPAWTETHRQRLEQYAQDNAGGYLAAAINAALAELSRRDAHSAPPPPARLETVAREFIAYYAKRDDMGGGCSNCGGLPHTDTCFVGRFEAALRPPPARHAEGDDERRGTNTTGE